MTDRPMPAAVPPGREGVARGNLLAAGSMMIWAAGFPAAEGLLESWPPLALVAARLGMALLLLGPLWVLLEGWPRAVPWARGLGIGVVGIGAPAVAILLAQAVTDPVTVAVASSVSPLAAALVEWALDRRRLGGGFLLGLAASVGGGVIATMGGGAGQGQVVLGGALSVLFCLLFAWGNHATVRRLPGMTPLGQTAVTVAGGGLAVVAGLAVALALGWTGLPEAVGAGDLGRLAVYGMGAMGLAQVMFLAGVRRLGVAVASFHVNVAPFYVMLILVALGEPWSWMQALGAAVVAVGVVLAQRR